MHDELIDLIGKFDGAYRDRVTRRLACKGVAVTGFQAKMLLIVARQANCSQHGIAGLVSRDKAQVARTVKELELLGLLHRAPINPGGRILKLTLSAKGQNICDKLVQFRSEISKEMLSSITSEECQKLIIILSKLMSGLDQAEFCEESKHHREYELEPC